MQETRASSGEIPKKIWNVQFTSIFFVALCIYLAQQLGHTMVPKYVYSMGHPASIIGTISGAFAATALIMKVFSGPMIDTLNRKYVFMGAAVFLGLSMFGYSISTNLPMLFASRLLQGAAQTFTAVCMLTMVTDILPRERLGQGLGTYWMGQAIAQAIGASLGLKLVSMVGYNGTFLFACGLVIVAIVIASRINLNYTRTKQLKFTIKGIAAKEALIPSALIFLLSAAFININSFLIIYTGERDITGSVGLYYTVYALTMMFSRPLVGKLADRFGFTRAVIPTMIIYACGFIVISFGTSLWMYLVAAVMIAFGWGASQPAIQALGMKCVSPDRRAAASNAGYIGNDFGNMLGPVFAGVVAERLGYVTMWRSLFIPIAIAVLLVLFFRKRVAEIESDYVMDETDASADAN